MTAGIMVLFDIDGTLVHTGGAGRRALERMFVREFGVENAFQGYPFSGRTDPRIMRDAFARWFGRESTQEEYEKAHAGYVELVKEELLATPHLMLVLPGVVDLLEALHDRNIPTGLATGNIEEGGYLKLRAAGLWHYFPFGGFGSDAEDRGELTSIAIRRGCEHARAEIPPSRCFVIGDSPLDVHAAHAVNAPCIAVMTGWSTREELLAEKPEYLLDDLSDTQEVLRLLRA